MCMAPVVPGGSASSAALAGAAAGLPTPPEGSSSTPAAVTPGGRVPSAALAGGTAGQPAPPEGMFGVPAVGGGLSRGAERATAPGEVHGATSTQDARQARFSPLAPEYWGDDTHDPAPLVEPPGHCQVYRATPAVTRSKAAEIVRSGVFNTGLPGAFALLAAEEEMMHTTGPISVSV